MSAPEAPAPKDGPVVLDDDSVRDDELVLEFVRGRNVACPNCGYNLRDAATSCCTECGAKLRLTLYPDIASRPWRATIAMWALVLAMLGCVLVGIRGMAEPRIPLIIIAGVTGLASLVLLWLLETRFWTYWAKYSERRGLLLGVCFVPLGAIALTVLADVVMWM